MKRCTRCQRDLPLEEYSRRATGSRDGRQSFCKDCDYRRPRNWGRRAPRVGLYNVKGRARTALNRRVSSGMLPRPDSLACRDCGDPAHEYDHPRGYDGAAAYDVEPVCRTCHGRRTRLRGEAFSPYRGRQAERATT